MTEGTGGRIERYVRTSAKTPLLNNATALTCSHIVLVRFCSSDHSSPVAGSTAAVKRGALCSVAEETVSRARLAQVRAMAILGSVGRRVRVLERLFCI